MIDLKKVLQLYSDLRDLGADALAWRQHLATQLQNVVGSCVTMLVEIELDGQIPRIVETVEYGWENGFDRSTWIAAQEAMHINPMSHVVFSRYLPLLATEDVAVASRQSLVTDAEWYDSPEYQMIHSKGGFDALAYASCSLKNYRDRRFLAVLNRKTGEAQFSDFDLEIVSGLLTQIADSVGTSLAAIDTPSPSQLPPRRRAVLDELLLGKSDKEIGQELGMAFDTVRGHVKSLFLFFGVDSRNELMARWVSYGQSRGE